MKLGFRFLAFVISGFCAGIMVTGPVHAQCLQPVQRAGAVTNVVTASGVTTVKYAWAMVGCDSDQDIGPLVRNGYNLSYNFDIVHDYCHGCPALAWHEYTNVVVGVLAPGTYTLVTSSWNVPVWTNTFTIAPLLHPLGFDTNGAFQIQLSCGVTNVSYVLQGSTDLVEWVPLSTNTFSANATNGIPLADSLPGQAGYRYYRVQCQ